MKAKDLQEFENIIAEHYRKVTEDCPKCAESSKKDVILVGGKLFETLMREMIDNKIYGFMSNNIDSIKTIFGREILPVKTNEEKRLAQILLDFLLPEENFIIIPCKCMYHRYEDKRKKLNVGGFS